MYGFVAEDILAVAILNVYLSDVLAVVALSLGQHPALLVVLKVLLKLIRVLVEFHIRSLVLIALCEEAHAVALPDDASDSTIFIIILQVLLIEKHIILILSVQEILLLFMRKAIEVNIISAIFIINISIGFVILISIYSEKSV